jgi:hypothetical protein
MSSKGNLLITYVSVRRGHRKLFLPSLAPASHLKGVPEGEAWFKHISLARGYESELLIEKAGKDISELQPSTTIESERGAYNYLIDLFLSFVGIIG